MKKVAILLITMILLLTSMAPALAVNITVSDEGETAASASEFAAYRLLNLTTSVKCTNTEEGHVHSDKDNCYRYAYTVNGDFQSVLAAETSKTDSADIVAYIAALSPTHPDDGDQVRAFADNIYRRIMEAGTAATQTSTSGSFTGLGQGYYLIVETKLAAGEKVYSLVMLDTAGQADISIETKKSVPTVVKKVENLNDSTPAAGVWGDSADHDIGDAVNYTITGTLPSDYASYAHYTYKFVDTLSKGLAMDNDQLEGLKVYVVNGGDEVEIPKTDTIEDEAVTNYTAEKTPSGEETVLTVNFPDLKAIKKDVNGNDITIDKDTKIVVKYAATLDTDANTGVTGNENTVVLKYENNPYYNGEGTPTTSETDPDTTIVFTFEATVNKVGEDQVTPLAGAGFTLYKKVYKKDAETGVYETEPEWVAIGSENKGTADDATIFDFKGLDVGEYKLVETTVPDGYNKAKDVFFEIVAEYVENTDPGAVKNLMVLDEKGGEHADFTLDVTGEGESAKIDGTVSTKVVNTTGFELPSTGGIGTTIFYVAGALLVLAAVALLITRKYIFHSK